MLENRTCENTGHKLVTASTGMSTFPFHPTLHLYTKLPTKSTQTTEQAGNTPESVFTVKSKQAHENTPSRCERATFITLQPESLINRLYLQLLPGSPTSLSFQTLAIFRRNKPDGAKVNNPCQTPNPHLDRFLRDVLVHLGGGILVQAVQEHLSQEERDGENG